jgi:large subunit ribosomal protein L1
VSDTDDKQDEIRQRASAARDTAAAIDAAAAATAEKKPKGKRFNRRFKPSKRYRALKDRRGERIATRPLQEAVNLLKEFKAAKFDETVELHVRLGINAKKSDQQIRGTFVFPHGIGQSKRVVCFAEGPAAQQAREAGAIEVGGEDLAKRIMDGWLEFDVVIAHPSMMRHVGRLGKILGPKKLMPNPKEGSVTPNVAEAVRDFSGGKAKFRVDDGGNLHVVAGKKSFAPEKLVDNVVAFLNYLNTLKPQSARGHFIQGASICATMSPGVAVDVGAYQA